MGLAQYYDDLQNPQALADAILSCLRHPMDTEALMNASNQMIKTYDYKNIAREYYQVFEKMKESSK